MSQVPSAATDPEVAIVARHPGAELVAAGVIRLALPTPTLPPATTTNHVLVGPCSAVVIDPAAADPHGQARLLALMADLVRDAGWRFEALVLTHHHGDHVGGAAALAAQLALPIRAHPQTAARLRDRLVVDRTLDEGDTIAAGWQILHTPGHAPGHVVIAQRAGGGVVAGDMVAAEGTIVIDPEDGGSMAAYLASLRRLADLSPAWLLPAHGGVLREPLAALDFYVRHRLEREARVWAALDRRWRASLRLLPAAYGDVPRLLWPLALRSLAAHLIHLEAQGLAERRGGAWRRAR